MREIVFSGLTNALRRGEFDRAALAAQELRDCDEREAEREATVQRATLWDGVLDTYQTEAELNGHRPEQGRLL